MPKTLPDKVKELTPELQKVWSKAYDMALKSFANNTTKAEKVADRAVAAAKKKGDGQDTKKNTDWDIRLTIEKARDDQQLVFGWGYLATKSYDGDSTVYVECHSEQDVPLDELEKCWYEYVQKSRKGGEMHERASHDVATLISGEVFTPEKYEAMGIDPAGKPMGLWVGYKVWDKEVYAKVKSGEYPMLSIAGKARLRAASDPPARVAAVG